MSQSKIFPIVLALLLTGSLAILTYTTVSAQQDRWTRQFGTSFADRAFDVTTDSLGNVYVVGSTNGKFPGQKRSGGKTDAFLRKYSQAGTELWTRQFGSIGDDRAQAVEVDHKENILVAGAAAEDIPGKASVGGQSGAYVRKFSPAGEDLWLRHFGVQQFSQASGVGVDRQGNVFVVGNIEGNLSGQVGSGSNDAFLRAYNANGEELWSRQFGTKGGDFATSVAVSAPGEVYVVGWNRGEIQQRGAPGQAFMSPFVRKYDGGGHELWSHQVPTDGFARATGAAADAQGNLYMVGWVSGSLSGQRQVARTDAFISKYTGDGKEIWTRQFGTEDEDRVLAVASDWASNAYVVGWTKGLFPGQTGLEPPSVLVRQDGFVRKFDGRGSEVWTRQFGTKMPQSANGVTAIDDGVYIVGETTGSLLGQPNLGVIDAFLMRLVVASSPDALAPLPPPQSPGPEAIPNTPASSDSTPHRETMPPNTPSPIPMPTPAPTRTPDATTVTPSAGGCTAAMANGDWFLGAWIMTVGLWPGLMLTRLIAPGSRRGKRTSNTCREDTP